MQNYKVKSEKIIRVGLVGLGYWGPNLFRNLLITPHTRIVACADLNEQRLMNLKLIHPDILFFRDYQSLLKQELDAVVIATPPSSHFKIAVDSLSSGKHVLLEKPITTSYKDAIKISDLAKSLKLTLMVDHIFVYSQPVVKLKELISSKQLGDLYYFDSIRVSFGLFQKDTNVLWDLACHDLSILDYLITENPISLSCIGTSHTKNGQIDIAFLTIKYRNNFLAHINVNWLAPTKIRRITVGGSKKMVIFDEGNVEERIKIYDRGITVKGSIKQNILVNYRVGEVKSPFLQAGEALTNVCVHFIECIRYNKCPLTDGYSGAKIVKLLELAEKALKSGKTLKF